MNGIEPLFGECRFMDFGDGRRLVCGLEVGHEGDHKAFFPDEFGPGFHLTVHYTGTVGVSI